MGTSISSILQVTTAVQGVPPGPATGLTVSSVTPTGLSLSWTAPATGSGPFEYQVQVQLAVAGTGWQNTGGLVTTTSTQIFGLASNTQYQFQVLSLNSSGTTASAVALATTSGLAPGAPTAVSVVGNPGPNDINLQWTAPATGSLPFSYQVYASIHGGNSYAPVGSPTTSTSIDITGLAQGSSYDFYVVAANSSGAGSQSPLLSGVTTATGAVAPSAPLNLATTTIDNTDITVTWSPPAVGTAPLSYVVSYRPHTS